MSIENGESKSLRSAYFVSFSESKAISTGMRQSIPRESSLMPIPPSLAGAFKGQGTGS